jgi:hypothetical protein
VELEVAAGHEAAGGVALDALAGDLEDAAGRVSRLAVAGEIGELRGTTVRVIEVAGFRGVGAGAANRTVGLAARRSTGASRRMYARKATPRRSGPGG